MKETDRYYIVLASGSPRRAELLELLGVEEFLIRPAAGEEKAPHSSDPYEIVKTLASAKAREVAGDVEDGDALVIGADTVVWLDGKPLGKPRTEKQAIDMLRKLSGRGHEVYTGVSVIADGTERCEAERTVVHFRDLEEDEILRYVRTGEPMDKAGAYGVQGKAALFVTGIEGDYYNVVGLPLCLLGGMLRERGVRLL